MQLRADAYQTLDYGTLFLAFQLIYVNLDSSICYIELVPVRMLPESLFTNYHHHYFTREVTLSSTI